MKLNKISIMLLEDIIILNIFVLPIKKILQFKSPEFISSHDKFTEIIKLIKENNFTYTYESLESSVTSSKENSKAFWTTQRKLGLTERRQCM